MNMKNLVRLSGCLLFIVSGGCVVIPVPLPETVVAGKGITGEQVTLITPGSTHREEVIRALGEPYAEFPDLRIVAYRWETNRGRIIWAAGGPGGAVAGELPVNIPYNLLIAFDAADRVVTFEKVSFDRMRPWESLREQALIWAETQGLVVPKAPPMFMAQEIAPGQSVLYLYLDGGFWNNLGLSLIKPEVRVNGKAVGWLRRGEYVAVALAPGVHRVTVDAMPRQTMKRWWPTVASIDVQTLSGQAQYVTVRVPDHAPPVLTVRSEAEALPALKELKPMP
ncbi:MAG TPA: hypothetical protein VN203_07530 [Candidatus Acidoferrum sp.]|nr:hypothetical protein [Candidatus Acidoferrum sp.]